MTEGAIPILVIEDAPEIRKFLSFALESNGYKPILAINGQEGLQQVAAARPELLILDLGLPDIDGHRIIQRVREWSNIPIIVLSARGQEQDKIHALENGADDYLTKPFGLGELLARIKVALRHAQRRDTPASQTFRYDALVVDRARRMVTLADEPVHLTPIEYQLLTVMVQHAGKVVTHTQLLKAIWGKHCAEHNTYLRIHMQHLRKKLKDNPLNPTYLITEPGIGYRLRSKDC
jgi:two-component system KDP operon response regulator KdpE